MLFKKVLSATTGFTDVKLKNGANLRFEIQGSPNENINIFLADLSIDIQEIIRIKSFCDDWNQAKLIVTHTPNISAIKISQDIIKYNDYIPKTEQEEELFNYTVYDNEIRTLYLTYL